MGMPNAQFVLRADGESKPLRCLPLVSKIGGKEEPGVRLWGLFLLPDRARKAC